MRDKMHIVFVCCEFPINGRSTGGFGTYVDTLSQALVKQNIKITIICQTIVAKQLVSRGRKIIAVTSPVSSLLQNIDNQSPSYLYRIISFLNYPLGFSLTAAVTIFRLGLNERIDIIEGGDFGAELLFPVIFKIIRLLQAPIVIKLHTPSFLIRKFNSEKFTLFYRVIEKLEYFCLKRVDDLYAPTVAIKTSVEEQYDMHISKVIPYPAPNIRTRNFFKRDRHLILYVGKIQTKKGVRDLARSIPLLLKKNCNLRFVFIGPDTNKDGISERRLLLFEAEQYGYRDSLEFIDPLLQSQLVDYYRRAAVLVVPSHWENFPNVILEGGLYSTPLVATRVGGIPEMVKEKLTGLLVSPHSPRQLARAIMLLLQHPHFARKLGSQLKQYVQRAYSQPTVCQLTCDFYAHLLRSNLKESTIHYNAQIEG